MDDNHIDRFRRDIQPSVVITQWTMTDGWPGFHVYLDAPSFGFDGDSGEHFIEAPNIEEARRVASLLSKATGWKVSVSFLGQDG